MRDNIAEMTIPLGTEALMDRTDDRRLENIYDAYASRLYRYALAITGFPEDAEDAVQEVFVRVARKQRRTARMDDPQAYLFSAVRNAAYSILRSRRRRDALTEAFCAELSTGEQGNRIGDAGQSRAVCEALAGLPVEQREALVLKVYDQMSFKEIAETVGASLGTVASRYRYGVDKLRKALEVTDDE